ncbi:MAG: TonB family protein [Bryobacteraceae bacterium]
METVASPPERAELRLLTEWGGADDRARWRKAGMLSIAVHVAGIVALMLMPRSWTAPVQEAIARRVTPLIAPLTEPTQTAPNRGPLSKEFDAESLAPRPRIQIPPSPPSTTRRAARFNAPVAAPGPEPPPPLAEPPAIDNAGLRAAQGPPVAPPLVQPPQIQAQEKPKLTFESPAAGSTPVPGRGAGRLQAPNASVSEAIRSVARSGSGGGLVVGDMGGGDIGGIGEGLNLPPSPGRQASNLELLSDPMGVDFRPYLIKILAAVRRNWFAVMPESAKLGRQGRVGIQFAISRDGSVPKLVIVQHSGTDALDRAAVAGISASNPFPPLPTEFKGPQVRLQFNFAYNVQR